MVTLLPPTRKRLPTATLKAGMVHGLQPRPSGKLTAGTNQLLVKDGSFRGTVFFLCLFVEKKAAKQVIIKEIG